MAFYPPEVLHRFLRPAFSGRAAGCNAVGTSASFECGCFVRVSLSIEPVSKSIRDARQQTNGCGYMSAAADAAAGWLIGKALTDMHAASEVELGREVESVLGAVPASRRQCVRVATEAVQAAFTDFRAFLIEEYAGERALICTCFGVAEETIENFIAANSPSSVEAVTAGCRAGGGCGSCRMLIQEMLDEHETRSGER